MRFMFFGILAFAFMSTAASAQQLWLTMDQVRTYSTEKPADSIIVGNPGIADIAAQDKNRFLLFGKAPGLTNIIILDDDGNKIEELKVRVNPPNDNMLVYHRGVNRTTYNCTNHCQATLTVGDETSSFTNVNSQVQSKLNQQSSGEPLGEIE